MNATSMQCTNVAPSPHTSRLVRFPVNGDASSLLLPKPTDHGAKQPYQPKHSPRILIATPTAHTSFLRGISRYARENRWQLETEMLHTGALPEESECQGIIAFLPYESDVSSYLKESLLPCVAVCMTGAPLPVPSIRPDDFEIGRLAGEHLIARGCHHFVWAPYVDDIQNEVRLEGFLSALSAAGHSCTLLPPAHLKGRFGIQDNWSSWEETASNFLRRIPSRTGLFAHNDCLSSKLATLADDMGINVPDDIAIIGAGNEEIECESASTMLSSIDPGMEQMSYAAAKLLGDILNGEKPSSLQLTIAPKGIVDRKSTALSNGENPRVERALRYISKQYSNPNLCVASVADAIQISRRQLERDFKAENDLTVREYIEKWRMEKAARLLIEKPEANISKIAKAVGISESGNFFRIFRRRFGMTPSAYRSSETEQLA